MTDTLDDLLKEKERLQSEHHDVLNKVLKKQGITNMDKETFAGLLVEASKTLKEHPEKEEEWRNLGHRIPFIMIEPSSTPRYKIN